MENFTPKEADFKTAVEEFEQLYCEYFTVRLRGVLVDVARMVGPDNLSNPPCPALPVIDDLATSVDGSKLVKFENLGSLNVNTAPAGHTLVLLGFQTIQSPFTEKYFIRNNNLKKEWWRWNLHQGTIQSALKIFMKPQTVRIVCERNF